MSKVRPKYIEGEKALEQGSGDGNKANNVNYDLLLFDKKITLAVEGLEPFFDKILRQRTLNKQAQDNLKTHVQEKLPEQYQKCMVGLQQVLKIGWNIVNSDSSTAANKLQAVKDRIKVEDMRVY